MQDRIYEKIKEKLGTNAKILKQIPTSNNQVYIIENQDKQYMFKIYHSKNWPEDGKLPYINALLDKIGIKYAKVVDYNRQYEAFGGGYVIEEKTKGIPATDNSLSIDELKDVYTKMAMQIKKVHKFGFENFGYLNFGKPDYSTFGNYVEDIIYEYIDLLKSVGFTPINNVDVFVPKFCKKLDEFKLKPVLCHGDLSIRNVLYNNGETLFVDWDDAMALPAYADIARMTYDMMWLHEDSYKDLKECFLCEYFKDENIKEFNLFEQIYHIFSGIEFITFSLTRLKNDKHIKNKINYLNKLLIDFFKNN